MTIIVEPEASAPQRRPTTGEPGRTRPPEQVGPPPRPSAFQRWWRPVVVGLLGGLMAYGASFGLSETYASGTRLLIRGREASFLTDNGQNVSQQPGIVDASFAKTLGETQAGLVTSEEMAIAVVDKLNLDKKPDVKDGAFTRVVRQGILVYAKTKAVLSHGYYKAPSKREQAIADVHGGLMAKPLKDSYILEIVGTADTPEGARDITNATADILVAKVGQRARADATRYADSLKDELNVVEADVARAGQAIADYKTSTGISSLESEIALDATAIGALRAQNVQNEIDLAGVQAQLKSIKASLAGLDPDQTGEQVIKTGRSETVISSNQPSSLYQDLVQQRNAATARLAELEARKAELSGRLTSTRQPELNEDQAKLLVLQQTQSIALQRLNDLSSRYAEAKATASNPGAELSRIDTASTPNYPVAPKHYLYLALGLLLGGLAGWGLTILAHARLRPAGGPDGNGSGSGSDGSGNDGRGTRLDLTAHERGQNGYGAHGLNGQSAHDADRQTQNGSGYPQNGTAAQQHGTGQSWDARGGNHADHTPQVMGDHLNGTDQGSPHVDG